MWKTGLAIQPTWPPEHYLAQPQKSSSILGLASESEADWVMPGTLSPSSRISGGSHIEQLARPSLLIMATIRLWAS